MERYNKENVVLEGSTNDSRVIYQNNGALQNQRAISVGLTAIPLAICGMWGKYIDLLFGAYTGVAAFVPLQFFLLKKYRNLYNKSSTYNSAGSRLVLSLRLNHKNLLEIEFYQNFQTKVNKQI